MELTLCLLDEMVKSTVRHDTITSKAAISACGHGGAWQLSMGLLAETART